MLSVKIFEELKKIGVSNQEVCEKLGWNVNKATDIKRGKSSLSVDELVRLAEIFHISLDAVVAGSPNVAIHNNGNNNINLATAGNHNSFFASQQPLSEFEAQLLKTYNSLTTTKKMELLTFALKLENKED